MGPFRPVFHNQGYTDHEVHKGTPRGTWNLFANLFTSDTSSFATISPPINCLLIGDDATTKVDRN